MVIIQRKCHTVATVLHSLEFPCIPLPIKQLRIKLSSPHNEPVSKSTCLETHRVSELLLTKEEGSVKKLWFVLVCIAYSETIIHPEYQFIG